MAEKELYEKLKNVHPDYSIWSSEWDRYSDVWGDKEPFDKKQYLVKGKQENTGLYNNRVALAEFIPESPLAIEKIVGALFATPPQRDLPKSLDEFVKDVTLRGDSIDEFMEEEAGNYLAYGTLRTLVNSTNPGEELTIKEEQDANYRPYCIRYTPLQTIDWSVDKLGNLTRIRLFEQDTEWSPITYRHEAVHRFIQYTKERIEWWTFRKNPKGAWEVIRPDTGSRENMLGEIPMVVRNLKTIKPLIGKSFLRYSSSADIQKFRAESDMIYDAHQHSHYTLVVKTTRDLKKVGVGTNTYIKLNPDDQEDAHYLNLPLSAFENQKAIADDRMAAVYRQAKTDPLGVFQPGQSAFLASGAARAWSFGTSEARLLQSLATKMADIERSIFSYALMYMGREDEIDQIDIKYPSEFDMSSGTQLIADTEQTDQLINSDTLSRVLHKRIAATKAGMSDKIADIYQEIDDNPLKTDIEVNPPPIESIGDLPEVEE